MDNILDSVSYIFILMGYIKIMNIEKEVKSLKEILTKNDKQSQSNPDNDIFA